MTLPALELSNIHKAFGAVQVLRGVDLVLSAGTVTALVGDNGAGKSTLVKCLAGLCAPDQGNILRNGVIHPWHSPADATAQGVQTVYQDLALCDGLSVTANLFLGREPTRVGLLDERTMQQKTAEVLATLNVSIPDITAPVGQLSGGQRQCVAVARAVLWGSQVVVMDEPTAALGVAQTQVVLDTIRRLRERGLVVLVVSHNLADVFAVADHVAVLRLGRVVLHQKTSALTRDQVVAAITGLHEAA